ncbi:MAG: alpha/beta hydrolase [Pirellulaceae bacterium]|nr:alpha/beta hydrolase [Pirellulaceae bacterium]
MNIRSFLVLFLGFVSLNHWTTVASAQRAGSIIPDVVDGHKDGLAMTMDLYAPEKKNGAAIVFIVSGGWVSRWAPPESLQWMFAPYLAKGYTGFAVRQGSSPKYGIPDAVAEVRRAIRFIRHRARVDGIDPERIGVMGMSAGGHLSLMLATRADEGDPTASDRILRESSRVQTVVAFVPPTDLTVAVWSAEESLPAYKGFPALDLPIEEAAKYSPKLHVTKDDAPALVIFGTKDKLDPPRHGK